MERDTKHLEKTRITNLTLDVFGLKTNPRTVHLYQYVIVEAGFFALFGGIGML